MMVMVEKQSSQCVYACTLLVDKHAQQQAK
jgi:hypothetical protein